MFLFHHASACQRTGVMKKKHSLPAFSGGERRPRRENFGSSFHLIMNEDFLRNAGLVGRDQESLWTPRLSLSTFILLDPRSAVLPDLVKKFVVIMMPLHSTTTRHDFDPLR